MHIVRDLLWSNHVNVILMYGMKAMGEIHSLVERELSASRADRFTPGKEPPVPIGYVAGYVQGYS